MFLCPTKDGRHGGRGRFTENFTYRIEKARPYLRRTCVSLTFTIGGLYPWADNLTSGLVLVAL